MNNETNTGWLRKSWISPLLTGCFVATAGTGVVMLLHVRGLMPVVKPLHEGISLLFLVAGLLHVLVNWRPLLRYFRERREAWAALGIACAVAVALAVMGALHGGARPHGPGFPDGPPPRQQAAPAAE